MNVYLLRRSVYSLRYVNTRTRAVLSPGNCARPLLLILLHIVIGIVSHAEFIHPRCSCFALVVS